MMLYVLLDVRPLGFGLNSFVGILEGTGVDRRPTKTGVSARGLCCRFPSCTVLDFGAIRDLFAV